MFLMEFINMTVSMAVIVSNSTIVQVMSVKCWKLVENFNYF